ncbi:hypothetical protein [Haliscomenobacter hydrossis]|uniref:Carboxypeptidase regulatory-like domain-containing protein n=1 Tax=Haliscomenobacter hydrossis (strain ATCC 27775 / DSM 1100 / LMG 10767 / O) TaxID=760192 RepID=F4L5M4_HALH1|nr:hypothetical protein [Haliscomenobacter hydrossis]AEE51859.1 hypothetical protein Halhy_4011 [Haliscomenobacter hydrossis DSM 1100]
MKNPTPQQPQSKAQPIKWRQHVMMFGVVIGILGGLGEFSGISLSNFSDAEKIQPKTTHRLFGKVIYWYTETPLAGVKVSVGKVSTLTDAKGRFELNVPIPTDKKQKYYKVNFYKKGYQPDHLDSISVNSKQEILIGLMRPIK